MRRFLLLAAALVCCAACSQPPAPSPTAAPTAEPAPEAQTGATAAPTSAIALPGVSGYPYPEPPPAPPPTATPAATAASASTPDDAAPASTPDDAAPTATSASVVALPGVSSGYPEPGAAPATEPTVVPDTEITATVEGHQLRLLVVATPEKRAQGLMFVQELPDDTGMLFVFPMDTPLSFWMRNTYIPLSVAFLDAEGRILNIEDMQPLDESLHSSVAPARYALEVNQGWFAARGIGPGAVVEFTLPPDLVVQ